MEDQKMRVERTWKKVKGWITQVTGAATEGYLPNIPTAKLPEGFRELAKQSPDFRVSVVKGGEEDEAAEDISLDDLDENLDLLREGEVDAVDANYTAHVDGFDVEMHMVVNPRWDSTYGLELVWWADQVFPDDIDEYERFQALVNYLIGLSELFHSDGLFIGPENLERPGPEAIDWVAV